MTASELLEQMLDTMTPENWHQGSAFTIDKTKACVLGRCDLILQADSKGLMRDWDHDLYCEVERLLEATPEVEPFREKVDGPPVGEFNDDPATTFEDVVLVVKKAYTAALENEA